MEITIPISAEIAFKNTKGCFFGSVTIQIYVVYKVFLGLQGVSMGFSDFKALGTKNSDHFIVSARDQGNFIYVSRGLIKV